MRQISIISILLFLVLKTYSIPVVKDTTEALAIENSETPYSYELDLTNVSGGIQYIKSIRFNSKYKNMYSLRITNNKSFTQSTLDSINVKSLNISKIVLSNNSLSEFYSFIGCTYIDLSYNQITNSNYYKLNTLIDTFIVNNNNIKNIEIDDPFFPIEPRLKSNLKYLDVSNNSNLVLDTSLTNNMPSINVFKASKTRTKNLSFLSKFPNTLLVLELTDNNIEDIPSNLFNFMNLEILKLNGIQKLKSSIIAKESLSIMKKIKKFDATNPLLYWERFPKNAKKGDIIDTLPNCTKVLTAIGYNVVDSLFTTVHENNYTLLKANKDLNKDSIITNIVTFSHPVFGKFTSLYNESDKPTDSKPLEYRLVPQQIKSFKIKNKNCNSGEPIELDADSLIYIPNLSYSQAELYRKDIPFKVKWKIVTGDSLLERGIDTTSILPYIIFKDKVKGIVIIKITAADSSGTTSEIKMSCGFVLPEEIIIKQDIVRFFILDTNYKHTDTISITKPDTLLINSNFDFKVIVKPKEAINNDTLIFDKSKFKLVDSGFKDSLVVYRLKPISIGKATITIGSSYSSYMVSKDFYIVENEEFLLAPNPVKDGQLELYFETEEDNNRILIYNSEGALIYNEVYNAIHFTNNKISPTTGKKWFGIIVDISAFTPGSYILKTIRTNKELIKNFIVE